MVICLPQGVRSCGRFALFMRKFFLGYTEKRKALFLPATRKRLFANSAFALQQRAEDFQRAIGKPFGRLRRGEILCDTGKRKVGPFPACRKETVLYTNFYLLQRAEGFQRAIGKPFGRLRRGEILCDTGKKKVGPFPACRKEAVLYTNFYLLQRAEGFQRATGKPFGRLRRGESLCDTGKRKVSSFPAARKLFYIQISTCCKGPKVSKGRSESPLVASAEAKPFVIREKKGRPVSCLPQGICFLWEVLPTHIGMGPEGVQGAIGTPPQRRNPL